MASFEVISRLNVFVIFPGAVPDPLLSIERYSITPKPPGSPPSINMYPLPPNKTLV